MHALDANPMMWMRLLVMAGPSWRHVTADRINIHSDLAYDKDVNQTIGIHLFATVLISSSWIRRYIWLVHLSCLKYTCSQYLDVMTIKLLGRSGPRCNDTIQKVRSLTVRQDCKFITAEGNLVLDLTHKIHIKLSTEFHSIAYTYMNSCLSPNPIRSG